MTLPTTALSMSYDYHIKFLAVIGPAANKGPVPYILHTLANLCCLQLAMLRSLSWPGVTPASRPWTQTVSGSDAAACVAAAGRRRRGTGRAT